MNPYPSIFGPHVCHLLRVGLTEIIIKTAIPYTVIPLFFHGISLIKCRVELRKDNK